MRLPFLLATTVLALGHAGCATVGEQGCRLEWIRPAEDGTHFVQASSNTRFVAWGFNYDHDDAGRLLEDYWESEWPTVVEDFREMKELGANVVRIHLQISAFMQSPTQPDADALQRLARLLALAEETALYLDVTGLGCYHKREVPRWYDAMSEVERWNVQARFWAAVAKICAHSPAVFCYDLMNEPILPGRNAPAQEWLAGEFAGKNFVQRIALDLAGRSREEVASRWVNQLVAAIRSHDDRHMITVGVIPWAYTFPGAKPLFYSQAVGRALDFTSVHFYPQRGDIERALTALAVYEVGKPLVVEEIFPLKCGVDGLEAFMESSRESVDGWLGFYWGKTIDEYAEAGDMASALTRTWLEFFRSRAR